MKNISQDICMFCQAPTVQLHDMLAGFESRTCLNHKNRVDYWDNFKLGIVVEIIGEKYSVELSKKYNVSIIFEKNRSAYIRKILTINSCLNISPDSDIDKVVKNILIFT